jgi:hypothetical protein
MDTIKNMLRIAGMTTVMTIIVFIGVKLGLYVASALTTVLGL